MLFPPHSVSSKLGVPLPFSLDGEVMLWDIRGGDYPVQTWHVDHGLSTFAVHEQARVFAA
jgi:regulator-associated protein of mTOR